ncbi:MAG TPA: endopeptidase La [Fimbriimonas sp.]|nr:endopeptidase La [Fimbriimonas sp.]
MPNQFPVVAIRDAVHFPGLINTLLVVREPSVKAITGAGKGDHRVVVLSQRDMSVEDPQSSDLFNVGILSEVLQATPLPDSSLRVALRGVRRVRATKLVARSGCFYTQVEELNEQPATGNEAEALSRAAVESFMRVVEKNHQIPPESIESVVHAETPGKLADAILHHLPIKSNEKQNLLEELDQQARLHSILTLLGREEQILALRHQITETVEKALGESQREYYLREQLRVIQTELHERESRLGETEEYRKKIAEARMTPEAENLALTELQRLERASASGPESLVMRNYLDTLIALPWQKKTEDRIDVREAQRLLDERHFGLEKVKDRILDYLAVRQLRGESVGSILCFVGPPGVGKTSLGRSIADAMARKFVRVALGGVRDEAEIRGHRRTYIGSMPGRILQGLRDCGSRNPVFVLDEVDKLGQGAAGDPMSGLLEALDPEQNRRFSDHYVEAPFDLGDVIFIATANVLESVPPALRDRMEVVHFPAYTEEERYEIGRKFLFPAKREESGLSESQLLVKEAALAQIVHDYSREAGVRELDRQIARLCRKAARQVAAGEADAVCVDEQELQRLLGTPRYSRGKRWLEPHAGLAWAMVVSEVGGDVAPVEASLLPCASERPDVRLTGNLGGVMKESALAAITYLQSRLETPLRRDVHIHVPEGGVPKDGPSAGLTVLLALASAHSGTPIKQGLAVTGEITLLGRVLPVGGVRDKLLAAIASEFTEVLLPEGNESDLHELPPSSRGRLKIHLVSSAAEAMEIAFP